ncbi:hypothetical protein U1Q18_042779 [Sarracenia purpurea var. burkii]
MEAFKLHTPRDQSLSPYIHRSHISRPSENFAPANRRGGILFSDPPSDNFRLPSQHKQPPLLPLPVSQPNNNSRSRGFSCPPIDRQINRRTSDQSLTPTKPKPLITPRKGYLKSKIATLSTDCSITESAKPKSPDQKDVSRVLASSSSSSDGNYSDLEKFSGSIVFTLSPPPSSLPLPTFTLRPKLSCKVETVGIDAGATDNLRRLLRLR